MAPPEIQEELLAAASQSDAASEPVAGDSWEALEDTEASMAYPIEEPALAGLSNDLIDFLSEAMDSPDDVEVTPQMISQYVQQNSSGLGQVEVLQTAGAPADLAEPQELVTDELPPFISDSDNRRAGDASEEMKEQVTVEKVEDRSLADRPARRRRGKQKRDKVPWLLVVVAVFLFLIFLAVIVIGLFFL